MSQTTILDTLIEIDNKVATASGQLNAFDIDPTAKYFTVELANSALTVIYKFRTGSIAGPIVSTITLNYATAQQLILTDGALT